VENKEEDGHATTFEGKDREFNLRILEVQLKHERLTTLSAALLALGGALIVFSLTIAFTIPFFGKVIPEIVWQVIEIYLGFGTVIAISALVTMLGLKSEEKKDVNKIREDFQLIDSSKPEKTKTKPKQPTDGSLLFLLGFILVFVEAVFNIHSVILPLDFFIVIGIGVSLMILGVSFEYED
jgi:ABC-type dipeptide/oligopeptide/nickel transport system permease subunit